VSQFAKLTDVMLSNAKHLAFAVGNKDKILRLGFRMTSQWGGAAYFTSPENSLDA
jgi:hypothetical protein